MIQEEGPVIGPMVLAGCLLDEEASEEFKKIKVRDSKTLTPKRREYLAKIIKQKSLTFEITITHPVEVDTKLNTGTNLNKIEAQKTAEIINRINKGMNKMQVIIDCPSPNIQSWQTYMERYINNKKNLIISCEHKADKNHISVSAASIIAKSAREFEVAKLKKKIGKNFGSGYSSDPVTRKFLEEYYKDHKKDGIFRETWQTMRNIHSKKEQKNLLDFNN